MVLTAVLAGGGAHGRVFFTRGDRAGQLAVTAAV